MAGKASPVTPEVLGWALYEDGRPSLTVAQELDVDEDTLLAWTQGDAQPTVGQVTRLAKLLHRPRALFFLPAPPEQAALPPSFRHPPGAVRDVSVVARRKVRQTRRVQEAVAWSLRDDPPVDVPWHSLIEDPEQVAAGVRAWTGVTSETQAGWRDEYAAQAGWREALDRQGVFVFVLAIGRDDVRGFASWDDRAPTIAVNRTGVSAAARCFTIGHELGHLVTRTDAACLDRQTRSGADVERWCEAFAASLLMPRVDVRRLAVNLSLSASTVTIANVRAVANRFRVSVYAAALRLQELGLADRGLYARVLQAVPPHPAPVETDDDKRPRNAPVHVERFRQYGPRVLQAVLGSLPPPDALSVLRMDVPAVRELSEQLPGVDARF